MLALMPNPDCSPSSSSLAASRCDTAELVKQAWQSARLCRPWCQAGLPSFPRPFLPTLRISLLSTCLGEAGALLAKSLLPIRFMDFFTTIRFCSHIP